MSTCYEVRDALMKKCTGNVFSVIGLRRPTHHCLYWEWITRGLHYLCMEHNEVPEDVQCSRITLVWIRGGALVLCRVRQEKEKVTLHLTLQGTKTAIWYTVME